MTPMYVIIQEQGPRITKRSNIFQLCTFHWLFCRCFYARERCVNCVLT